jgi:acyl carrier protein
MSEREDRLVRCFTSVFPWVAADEICNLRAESGDWDSLSAVTLSAVIQEEFALEIDPRVLPTLDSYESFRAYVYQAHSKDEESLG